MNRRGAISLFTIFVLILFAVVLGLAQKGVDTATINKTIDTLNWTKIGSNVTKAIQTASDNSPNEIAKAIFGIANKAVDFFGYAIFEISKLAMGFARDHPDIINYKVLFALILLSLLAPLIYPTFVIVISLYLIIKEWFLVRREKRALKIITEKEVQNDRRT